MLQTWTLTSKSFQTSEKTGSKPVRAAQGIGLSLRRGRVSHNSSWQMSENSAAQLTRTLAWTPGGKPVCCQHRDRSTQGLLVGGGGPGTGQARWEGAGLRCSTHGCPGVRTPRGQAAVGSTGDRVNCPWIPGPRRPGAKGPSHKDHVTRAAPQPRGFWVLFFWLCPWHMKFPGQGSNLRHNSDNARSLTH